MFTPYFLCKESKQRRFAGAGAPKFSTAIAPLTFFVKKVSKETFKSYRTAKLFVKRGEAIKILGTAHPLRVLLTSFLKEVSKTRHILHLILYKKYGPL